MFGAGDNLGLVNLMTPERIAAAARLVRRGQIFCLDMPLGSVSPALATFRRAPRHRILHQPGTVGFDDVYDNLSVRLGPVVLRTSIGSLILSQAKHTKESS